MKCIYPRSKIRAIAQNYFVLIISILQFQNFMNNVMLGGASHPKGLGVFRSSGDRLQAAGAVEWCIRVVPVDKLNAGVRRLVGLHFGGSCDTGYAPEWRAWVCKLSKRD